MKERVAMKNIVVDVQYIQAEFQNKRFSEKELLLNAQASGPCWMNDLRRRILRHDVIPQLSGPNLEFIVPISPIPPLPPKAPRRLAARTVVPPAAVQKVCACSTVRRRWVVVRLCAWLCARARACECACTRLCA